MSSAKDAKDGNGIGLCLQQQMNIGVTEEFRLSQNTFGKYARSTGAHLYHHACVP